MFKRFLVLFAAIILSVTLGCAGKNNTRAGVSSSRLFKEPTTGMELVYVEGGCYRMGDVFDDPESGSEERPVHEGCVDDFYIGRYEVTQGQWVKVMGTNPSVDSACGDDCPVDNVSWNDAQAFISRLNSLNGSDYRLPTEAEWEYAARSGGKREIYSGGNDVDSVAWYNLNSGERDHPVGTKAPNGLGIYDMSGSVWEWTNDWYASDYYSRSPRDNPEGPTSGVERVVRGGCRTGEAYNMRTARRNAFTPDTRRHSLGFRLKLAM